MLAQRWSPPITHVTSMGARPSVPHTFSGAILRGPSTRRVAPPRGSCVSARYVASRIACSMPRSSTSPLEAAPKDHFDDHSLIGASRRSRIRAVSRFESFKPAGIGSIRLRRTAPTTTGPAAAPLPTSSSPMTLRWLSRSFDSFSRLGLVGLAVTPSPCDHCLESSRAQSKCIRRTSYPLGP